MGERKRKRVSGFSLKRTNVRFSGSPPNKIELFLSVRVKDPEGRREKQTVRIATPTMAWIISTVDAVCHCNSLSYATLHFSSSLFIWRVNNRERIKWRRGEGKKAGHLTSNSEKRHMDRVACPSILVVNLSLQRLWSVEDVSSLRLEIWTAGLAENDQTSRWTWLFHICKRGNTQMLLDFSSGSLE